MAKAVKLLDNEDYKQYAGLRDDIVKAADISGDYLNVAKAMPELMNAGVSPEAVGALVKLLEAVELSRDNEPSVGLNVGKDLDALDKYRTEIKDNQELQKALGAFYSHMGALPKNGETSLEKTANLAQLGTGNAADYATAMDTLEVVLKAVAKIAPGIAAQEANDIARETIVTLDTPAGSEKEIKVTFVVKGLGGERTFTERINNQSGVSYHNWVLDFKDFFGARMPQ